MTASSHFADTAYDLRVGASLGEPIGYHDERPTFSWKLPVDSAIKSQSAYQVAVAASPEALVGKPDLWDSGKRMSDQSVWVPYEGPPLASRQKVWWRVRFWDQVGRGHPWSEARRFEMGLLANGDWEAEWIRDPARNVLEGEAEAELRILEADFGLGERVVDVVEELRSRAQGDHLNTRLRGGQFGLETGVNSLRVKYEFDGRIHEEHFAEADRVRLPEFTDLIPVSYFRKEINLAREVEEARLYATAFGAYEFHINGQRVGEDELAPGWTEYEKRVSSLTYDVTDLLRPGANALHCLLGQGWYSGKLVREHLKSDAGRTPKLMAQLEVTYADGTRETFVTDGSWHVSHDGPIRYSDLYEGERYEQEREFRGIGEVGFDDRRWARAKVVEVDAAVAVRPKSFGSVKRQGLLAPKRVVAEEPGRVILDFGVNLVGWPRIRIPMKSGQTLRIRFAEMLQPNGEFFTENYRTAASTNYITAAWDGVMEWEPTFTFHGYRYVEVSGLDAELRFEPEMVQSALLHTEFEVAGKFESSNEKLNQLQSCIVWSARGNFLEVPTDCPQRDERLGWTGDAQVFARSSMFNFDLTAFWEGWLETMREEQREDGRLPVIVPGPPHSWGSGAGWSDACVIVPWEVYIQTGRREMLEENYEMMQRWLGYHQSVAEDYVSNMWTFGDWLQPNATDRNGDTSRQLIATAYFARCAELLSRIAGVLGREQDADLYGELARRVKGAFDEGFFDARGRLAASQPTQTGYLMALGWELLPEEKLKGAVEGLMETLEAADGHLRTGFLGTALLVPTLDAIGRTDLSYELLLKETYPSWLYIVDQGATTMWERWDAYSRETGFAEGGSRSLNHYAYGAIGQWMYERVAGLEPDPANPGYKHFFVRPAIGGGLDWARAELETPYGRTVSAWKREGNSTEMEVVVPPNAMATVVFPYGRPGNIQAQGGPLAELEGLVEIVDSGKRTQAKVVAGSYRFVIE